MGSLTQLFLTSSDLETTRRFYEAGLGLDPRKVGEESVAYETGACELKIQADFDPEQFAAFGLEPPGDGPRGTGAVVVLTVEEPLEECHERLERTLEDRPGELLVEPRSVPWGGRIVLARDPDGYVVEIRSESE